MKPTSSSPCIATTKVAESRDFYVKHFAATVTFDCGCNPTGLTYNFRVQDVDREFEALMRAGIIATVPLEDHPWGDRGFAVQDPNGVTLYIYSDREPTAEFKQYIKV